MLLIGFWKDLGQKEVEGNSESSNSFLFIFYFLSLRAL